MLPIDYRDGMDHFKEVQKERPLGFPTMMVEANDIGHSESHMNTCATFSPFLLRLKVQTRFLLGRLLFQPLEPLLIPQPARIGII